MAHFRGMVAGVAAVLLLVGTAYSEPPKCVEKETTKAGVRHVEKHKKHAVRGGHFWGRIFTMLDLDDEQKKKASDIRLEYRKAVIRLGADIDVAEVELRELLMDEPVDLKAVKAKIQEIVELKGSRRFYRIESLQKLKGLLTPQQRKRLMVFLPDDAPAGRGCRVCGPSVW